MALTLRFDTRSARGRQMEALRLAKLAAKELPLCPKCNKPMNRKTFEAGNICAVCQLIADVDADPDFGDKTDVDEDGMD